MKQVYVIEFSSANYAGGPSHCLVTAETEEEATELAWDHMEEIYYEEDIDQLQDENEGEEIDGPFSIVNRVEPLAGSEDEEYTKLDTANIFYPMVN